MVLLYIDAYITQTLYKCCEKKPMKAEDFRSKCLELVFMNIVHNVQYISVKHSLDFVMKRNKWAI